MDTKQINLKLSKNLHKAAENYLKHFGFRNMQELIAESIREKIFEHNQFDENFSEQEIDLIDSLIENSIKDKKFISEQELNKILLQ